MNIPLKEIQHDEQSQDKTGKHKNTFARGWHCLGLSRFFGETPKSLECFGTKLVAYRGSDLKIHVLDAWCPHMGADLALGKVQGKRLVCPFHHWEWGSDGICKHIPYADSIPGKAKIRAWHTLEKNGLLYIWHDAEGNPPISGQEIPEMPEYYSDEWTDWMIDSLRVNNNSRELIDNMADIGHFGPVHNASIGGFSNVVEGHTYKQKMEGDAGDLKLIETMTSEATYYGPAVMTTSLNVQIEKNLVMRVVMLVANLPVTENSFELTFGMMVKRFPGVPKDISDYIVQKYADATRQGFLDDVHIWHNKVRVDNPVLCDGDGPVNKLRQWYEQFYMNIADVPEQWRERREYVVSLKKDADGRTAGRSKKINPFDRSEK